MSAEPVVCPELNRLGSVSAAHRKAHALRYDGLSRVLINVDQHAHRQEKPRRDRKSGRDQAELAELWVHVATLKAENDRLTEQVTDELHRFANRVAKLEARARPWWWRMLDRSGDRAEPKPRNRASERLRTLYFGSAGTDQRLV
jgi:hypothetical protein